MKPVIGLMPLYDDEKESYWMLPGYMTGIEAAGGIPIMLPLTDNDEELKSLADLCDGFLFTGGHDVSPGMYACKEASSIVISCPARDVMEMKILQIARDEDKPVFGICRGIQFINAALGGTLYQDLPTQHPSDIEHHMSPPYDRSAHDVFIDAESPLGGVLFSREVFGSTVHEEMVAELPFRINNADSVGEEGLPCNHSSLIHLSVNSYHHQAIKDLAPPLRAAAWSKDGIIEAVYEPEKKFLLAIQWHPEFDYKVNDDSMKLFRAFVDAAVQRNPVFGGTIKPKS